jgi:F420-dependent oxidoreductase-like protein
MMLAQQALTVNAAASGRLALGIGLSHKIVVENMWGMSYDKPVRHLREYLTVLTTLLDGGNVALDGEAYRVHAGLSATGSPRPGVYVAALGEQMLRVTGALADGTVTWCTGPETLRSHIVPTLCAAAEAAGRPVPRVISALPVCVTDDREAATARAAEIFQMYGYLPSYRAMLDKEGAAGPETIAIVGGEAEVADRIGALADIGVTDFAASEFPGNPDEAARTRDALRSLL